MSSGRVALEGRRVTVSMHQRKEGRMDPWRVRSVWWTLGLGVVVALVLGAPAGWAQEDPCAEFSGACHGQCRAALAQGCFENPDTRQCGKREAQWRAHDCGGIPPWVPEGQECPCQGLATPQG